ncbi:hypothetical protein GT037_005561 [Alternaria burnsii]|uniref:Uncharacterized protein n=1 Tax=Alternaria burnsii TaxID=1187904 RepID=A0A8H7EHK5_9PLEO|nr:uncharacterized protein GT037_005561 [Alternaria burnsii]KAF7676056.1 hypothetical protein GT037_005561 [Alternaria burnsii]
MKDTLICHTARIYRHDLHSLLNIGYHFIARFYAVIATAKRQPTPKVRVSPTASSLTSDQRACVYILSGIFLLTSLHCQERNPIVSKLEMVPSRKPWVLLLWDEMLRVITRACPPFHLHMQRFRWMWVVLAD